MSREGTGTGEVLHTGEADVGLALRHARERQGLSLGVIADRTNISLQVLEAIERNAFAQVPKGVFTRGHLRAYAREVGLDGERIVSEYLLRSDPAFDADVLEQLRARFHTSNRDPRNRSVVQLALVIAGIACLLYVLLRAPSSTVSGDALHEEGVPSPGVSILLLPVDSRAA